MKYKFTFLLSGLLMFSHQAINAQTDSTQSIPPSDGAVFEMSLEDLLNVEVTSVSKKSEKLQNVASSIYVLTKEDIMRSGATNFFELLRQVPGFWGAQEEYNDGAATMRYSSPKNSATGSVLYLLDGTPIQELMNATISFRNFDLPLDEIERIEVIKGSGGTVYGANSATGVVNIFTKDASKYDTKLNFRVEAATSGYAAATVRAGGKITEKFALSGYGRYRQFNGYGLMDEFDGTHVTVPNNTGTGMTTITNRINPNYEHQYMLSGGLKANYEISEKTKLAFHSHLNSLNKNEYTYSYPAQWYGQRDILYYNKVNTLRVTNSLRLDHTFNDKHSIFFRLSNNHENDFFRFGSGYKANNGMYDLEVQDNLTLGKHDLSFGANYRWIKFDINNINDPTAISYVDPQSKESLKGLFVQDKFGIIKDKLNLIAGVKAEQYTLVNDKFYLSPSLKLAFIASDKLTLWGGFTQSYTTPGFNHTNVDLTMLKVPSYGFFYQQVAPSVRQGVYNGVYQQVLQQTGDETTAKAQAEAYIASPAGQNTIAQQTSAAVQPLAAQYPNNYNVGVRNGTQTVPTKFQTFEFGFRSNNIDKVSIESNFFYTILSDGIGASPTAVMKAAPSLTKPGERVDYYTYGNYLKGTSVGNETVIKTKPLTFLTLEGSLTWLKTKLEYQNNPDFDINALAAADRKRSPSTPVMPEFIWRFKTYVDLPMDFYISASVIYATKSNTDAVYQYQYQRYLPLLSKEGGVVVATNRTRTIANFKIEKKFADKKMSVYVFGNDVFNKGLIENTNSITNVTLSQIKAMYGFGASYSF